MRTRSLYWNLTQSRSTSCSRQHTMDKFVSGTLLPSLASSSIGISLKLRYEKIITQSTFVIPYRVKIQKLNNPNFKLLHQPKSGLFVWIRHHSKSNYLAIALTFFASELWTFLYGLQTPFKVQTILQPNKQLLTI